MATENLEIIIGANTQDLQTGLNQASQSVTNFGNAVRANTRPTADATNALSNLSRVAQDAPYGFMGIANNLNPLLESFQRLQKETGGAGSALKAMAAGLMGPAGIGLALGAVSSLIVAFGDDILNYINGTDAAVKAQNEFNKSLEDSKTKAAEQATSLNLLIAVAESANATDKQRAQALNAVKDAIGKVNKDYADHITSVDDAKKAVQDYTQALIQQAIVQRYQDKIADKTIELTNLTKEVTKATNEYSEAQRRAASMTNGYVDASVTQAGVIGSAKSKLDDATNAYKNTDNAIKELNQDLKTTTDTAVKMPFFTDLLLGKTGSIKPAKITNAPKSSDVDTSTLERLKKEQQLYKDDFYLYKDYADKIALETKKIEELKTKGSKNAANELIEIDKTYGIQLEINKKELGDKLTKLFDDQDKKWVEKRKANNKELLDAEKDFYSNNIRNIKDNLDLENKLADDDYNKKKENTKKAMALLSVSLLAPGLNKKTIQELLDAYDELAKKLKLLGIDEQQKDTKNLQEGYKKFADVIAENVTNALFTMYDAIQAGEPPLKALGDYVANLAKQFAAAVVQATIFKGLMSLLNVATGGGSGFFGSILGGVSKLLGFAEGGIVSQPTIAMVGEGGQSEAIMPLNKLGNMMNSTFNAGAMSGGGAGNGQFVLKGNDLVLALQRSNYSLNLRRGA
jgi:hypothetical protein